MNLHEKNTPAADRLRLAESLVEAALVDTVYGDLYLQRARDFLTPALSEAEFAGLQRMETEAQKMPDRILVAMKQANWIEVKNLSSRISSFKRTLTEKETLLQFGKKIYELGEPPLDPFSPGLQALAKSSDLQALLQKLLAQLELLETADADWKDFYRSRIIAAKAIETFSSQGSEKSDLSGSRLEHKAYEALNNGDFDNLEKMAALMGKEDPGGSERPSGAPLLSAGKFRDLTLQFPQEVLNRTRGFGLAPIRIEGGGQILNLSPEDVARLYRHLWQPAFSDEISRQGADWRKKEIQLPVDAPADFRDLVELFALHPFVNSGGARFVPVLVEEDVLVEDFDEPDPGTDAPASALLSALGFEDRRGLSRISIEKALFDRGNTIVRGIGLDPRVFRLILIPPDVYGRVGPQRGWGQKPLWTHFDGYIVMKNGKLGALAGGDVRSGGLFDLEGISRDYESHKLIARFAVVQRRRLEAVG